MTRRRSVAVIPGDDAAPEAVNASVVVLEALAADVEWRVIDDPRDASVRAAADAADTVLFGATSGRTGGMGYLRLGRGAYANVRPIRWRLGLPSPLRDPEQIDYVIVRENTEDVYCGIEGDLTELTAAGLDLRPLRGTVSTRYPLTEARAGRFAVKAITEDATQRVTRFACELARERRVGNAPGALTIGGKWNVLPRTDGLFRDVALAVAAEYNDVDVVTYLADDLARRLVASPEEFDVIVLPNLYGDILSDEGAATVGGLGVCPSGCYGDDNAYFEPVHGTAPDLAGRGAINPIATLLSAVMLLEYLELSDDARRLERAVDAVLSAGSALTRDLGGRASTSECADAIASQL